jgi:hypothetical protein
VSSVGYKVATSALVALTAATPRTALMVVTPAQFGAALRKLRISFNGTDPEAVPALWEIVRSTNASNSTPGTNNTNETSNIVQYKGRPILTGFTAFSASTAEPTVLTQLDGADLTPQGGLLVWDAQYDDEFECDVSAGLGVRLTTPAGAPAVSARVTLHFERL